MDISEVKRKAVKNTLRSIEIAKEAAVRFNKDNESLDRPITIGEFVGSHYVALNLLLKAGLLTREQVERVRVTTLGLVAGVTSDDPKAVEQSLNDKADGATREILGGFR